MASELGLLSGLNPFALLTDARQVTLREFLCDFYTQRGQHDKLGDVDALVRTYSQDLPQLYIALDKKYGTNFSKKPPPVVANPNDAVAKSVAFPTKSQATTKPTVNKVILLGNSGVGKTNLLSRLSKDEFNDEFTSTIGVEFLTHVMRVDGVDVKAQIWDTAGQERFHAMMATYYRKTVGALLIFDVTSRSSLDGVERWLDQLLNVAEPGLHAVLVGNKCDASPADRKVSCEEARAFAAAHHMAYVETSAKTGEHVETAFRTLITAIHRSRQQHHDVVHPTTIDFANTGTSDSMFGESCVFF